MDLERLDGWCEKGILGLVLAVLVFGPLATGAVRPQDFVVIQGLTVGILSLWLLRFWINPKHRLLWPPLCWAVVVFMGFAIGRYFTAEIEFTARQETLKVTLYGFLFLAILNNLHKLKTTQIISLTLLFLAVAIALYAVFQFLTDSNHVWHFTRPEIYRKRGSGTYICPNHMAGFLEMLLPLGLVYTLTGRFPRLTKTFLGYASLLIFAGITVSLSRGGWIATGASLFLLFFLILRQRDYRIQSLLLVLTLVTIAAIFFWRAEFSANRKQGFTQAGQTEDLRFRLWAPAFEMWQDHLWFGVGPDHFNDLYPQYRSSHDQVQGRPQRVHNDYLNTLVDWGLIGGCLVASAWLLFYGGVLNSWRSVQQSLNDLAPERSNESSFVLGASIGLFAILVHSLVDFNMHIPANAILTVTLMALTTGHFRSATERYWISLPTPLRCLLSFALLAGTAYLGFQTWRTTVESVWLARAETQVRYSSEQIHDLKKAFRAQPGNPQTAYQIGEAYRLQSWRGDGHHRELGQEALSWLGKALQLNPLDPFSTIRYGMCLDWLGDHDQAEEYFKKAVQLDPNGFYTIAHVGWHYVQVGQYLTARKWLEKSLRLYWVDNPVASSYYKIVEERLAQEQASPSTQPP